MRLAAGVAALAAVSLGSAAGAQRAPASPAAASPFDVTMYMIQLSLPDSGTSIRAQSRLTVRRTRDVTTLPLDFVGMTVRSAYVSVHGTPSPAPFTRFRDTLRVTLPPWPGHEDTLMVGVNYDGTPSDGLLLGADSSGRARAFADNWPNRARFWFPSVDRPDDKARVRWLVHAPGRTVIANGRQRFAYDSAGRPDTTSGVKVWEESRPIPTYLMVVAVAPFARRDLVTCAEGDSTCVPQSVFVAPEAAHVLPGPFARAPEMVAYFARLVGPFPYEKLWHVQTSTQFGGMENASAIFYPEGAVRTGTLREEVVAHETAHQWFGDAVTERTFADLWLSEGFATYFAALWAGHAYGDSALRAAMRTTRAEVLASAASRMRPVRDTAETEYMKLLNTNSYQKGGWVLHMLRGEVGDSAFFRGIRAYYATHRDGNATSADLRAAMERSAGRDLRWFFLQWLTRAGTPAFSLVRVGAARGASATYEVRQTSAQPYAFPLTVAATSSGRRATVRVPAQRVARVTLPAGALTIDPDVALLWAPAEAGRP